MNRFKTLLCGIVIFFYSAQELKAIETESGGIFWVSVEKRFNKYFMIQMQQHIWLDNNFRNLERYMSVVDFRATLLDKYIYFDALYYYRYMHTTSDESKNTHRYQLGLSGEYKLPHVKFSVSSRFESNYIKVEADTPYNRCNWRNRFQVTGYPKKECKFAPYGAIEMFNTMNWPDKNGVERLWFDFGTTYRINKVFSMDFKVREILPLFQVQNRKLTTYVGVGCMVKL
ncbi:MAG: DUF2490 domain-containing protein [Bacteroidales bacterium]